MKKIAKTNNSMKLKLGKLFNTGYNYLHENYNGHLF